MLSYKGMVTSGLKKAGQFMQKDTYVQQYQKKLGFLPYNGTLNIKLDKNIKIDIKKEFKNQLKIIHGNEKLGDVYFLDSTITTIDNKISKKGSILFPIKTVHTIDTLEFVAPENLRESMNLKDNTKVQIFIEKKSSKDDK